jgi:hypothetical protein
LPCTAAPAGPSKQCAATDTKLFLAWAGNNPRGIRRSCSLAAPQSPVGRGRHRDRRLRQLLQRPPQPPLRSRCSCNCRRRCPRALSVPAVAARHIASAVAACTAAAVKAATVRGAPPDASPTADAPTAAAARTHPTLLHPPALRRAGLPGASAQLHERLRLRRLRRLRLRGFAMSCEALTVSTSTNT